MNISPDELCFLEKRQAKIHARDVELVELVKANPSLWDTRCQEYRQTLSRATWEEIGLKLGFEPEGMYIFNFFL